MKNVAYTQVGHIVICYYNAEAPTDLDHRESIEFFRTLDFDHVRVLALTEGGSPSTIQRKEFNDALKGHEIQMAVVTDSRLVRGTLTAYGWFNRNIRAFSFANIDDALTYLQVPDTQHQKFFTEVQMLQDEVSGRAPPRASRTRPLTSSGPPRSSSGTTNSGTANTTRRSKPAS